jgi:hypothetical protein
MTDDLISAELPRARHVLEIGMLQSWESLSQRSFIQAQSLELSGQPVTVRDYLRELATVSAEEVAPLGRTFDVRLASRVDSADVLAPQLRARRRP